MLEKYEFSWVKYFSNDKIDSNILIDSKSNVSLRNISKNDSNCDVILFKIGPAIGWNIPRACILVQLRNVSSKNLSTQTLGRIKRYPNPLYPKEMIYENSISNTYYVYSNIVSTDKIRQSLVLKDKYKNDQFLYGIINQEKIKESLNKAKYEDEIIKVIDKNSILERFSEYKKYYEDNNRLKGETRIIESKTRVFNWINNSIELEIFINKQKNSNKNILTKDLIMIIENMFTKLFAKDSNNILNKNMYWYIMSKDYLEKFHIIYRNNIKKIIDNDNNMFEIKNDARLPLFNKIFFEDTKIVENNSVNLNNLENYAYDDLKLKNHHFDSKLEKVFIERLKNYIEDSKFEKIRISSKVPIFGGTKIEYFDEKYEIRKSYLDFLIEINSDNFKDYLYIEVKSLRTDYNKEKIKLIIVGYKKYLLNKEIKLN